MKISSRARRQRRRNRLIWITSAEAFDFHGVDCWRFLFKSTWVSFSDIGGFLAPDLRKLKLCRVWRLPVAPSARMLIVRGVSRFARLPSA